MANDKCDLCGGEPIVTIAGITRNINLCQVHISPPYDMGLVRNIINEIKADTVVSFLKTIYDWIKQDEKITDIESQISTLIEHTKLNSVNQLTKERDDARSQITELEARISTLEKAVVSKGEELKKSSSVKQAMDKLQTNLSEKIHAQKTDIISQLKSESQSIVSQLKPVFSMNDSTVGRRTQINSKKRRTEPNQVEIQNESDEELEKDDPETGDDPKTEPESGI